MERKIHKSFKSSYLNMLFPPFLKQLIYFIFIYSIFYFTNLFFDTFTNLKNQFWQLDVFLLITPIFIVLVQIMIVLEKLTPAYYTIFTLYENHIEKKYSFITEKTHSINYSQITDMRIRKNIWDKIYGTGNLIIYTGADNYVSGRRTASLNLKAIKYPNKIRDLINKRIHNKIEFNENSYNNKFRKY